MGETCVDKAMPGFLIEHGMDAFVVNGRCIPRVLSAIRGEKTTGTVLLVNSPAMRDGTPGQLKAAEIAEGRMRTQFPF